MSYTLYDGSVNVAKYALASLTSILKVAEAHPSAASFPTARLYEDMLPLTFQVHTVTDTASKLVARLTGVDPTPFENNLSTYEEMHARIAQVVEIVEKADKEVVNGRAGESVTMGLGPGVSVELKAWEYLQGYGLPNMFFHLNMTYAILRNQGVPLGKRDYSTAFLGNFIKMPGSN